MRHIAREASSPSLPVFWLNRHLEQQGEREAGTSLWDSRTSEEVELRGDLPASLLSPVLLHLPTPVLIHWIQTVCAICSCRRVLPSSCQKQSLLYFALSTFSHNFCPQGLCSLHQILKLWRQSDVGSLPPPLLIIFDFCINLILLSFSFLSYKKNWITWLSKLNCREYVKCLKLAVSPEFSYLCGGALEHCG